ncbi:hypothetical protein N2152v2_007263 [Parachlorella kessleri]
MWLNLDGTVAGEPPRFQFPESTLFDISSAGAPQCRNPTALAAHTLQYALRLCLARPSCFSVKWEERSRTAHLCGDQPTQQQQQQQQPYRSVGVLSMRRSLMQSTVFSALRKSLQPGFDAGEQPCPEGHLALPGVQDSHGNPVCGVCTMKRCSVLPGAQPVKGFPEAVEGEEDRFHNDKYHFRGINPTMVAHIGQSYVVVRSANYTLCPSYVWTGEGKPSWDVMEGRVPLSAYGYSSEVLVCPADWSMRPRQCRNVPIDTSKIQRHSHFYALSKEYRGLEDARAFSWRGRVYLVGTLNEEDAQGIKNNQVALVRLRKDFSGIDQGRFLEWGGMEGPQKNYMPLVLNDTLYLVIQTFPLIVGEVDPGSLRVRIVQRDNETDNPFFLGAVSATAAERGVVTKGRHLSGGSPFMWLEKNRYLTITHHSYFGAKGRVYVHHFTIVSVSRDPAGRRRFSVDWVSDAFRLPEEPKTRFGVQFVTGILRKKGSLYISYGVGDCFSALARIDNIDVKLRQWEEFGIGSQHWERRSSPGNEHR